MFYCRKLLKNQKGFTLLELVVVIIILGIVSVVIVNIINNQAVAFTDVFANSDLLSDGKRAMDVLRKDLHGISADSISAMTAANLSFASMDGHTVTYVVSSGILLRNGTAIAENITANPFGYLNASQVATASATDLVFIAVNLQLNKLNESLVLEELIFLRN